MSIDLFYLYRKSVFQLAKTLVIKSSMAAEAINSALYLQNVNVLALQPETWKYYKNIAGEYHSTDVMMRVTSTDTLETIDFTKANLAIHRSTAREYQYGSKYYNDLVSRYPNQTALILGILHPVDKTTAIEAADGTILYYDTNLVEDNEVNLIPNLEAWIKRWLRRWNTSDYRLTHDLYTTSLLGVLFLNIPGTILNLRLDNCKTRYVHSYHIRAYLASNGQLDRYMDVMTKKQALFLYRNIRYLVANAGKQETFELLTQKLLTDRGYPLTAYDITHNTELMPDEIYPAVELLQRPINQTRSFGYTANYTVDEILTKEAPLAKDNQLVQDEYRFITEQEMSTGAYNALPTKVLESSIIDDTDTGIKSFADVLLDHWLFFASTGYYNAIVGFTHPLTGERVLMSARDSFVLAFYAIARTQSTTLVKIPKLRALSVRRIVLPTVSYIKSITDKRWVTTADINTALGDQLSIIPFVSIENFYDGCVAIHQRLRDHYYQYATESHRDCKAHIKAAVLANYVDYECTLYSNKTYANWFTEKAFSIADFTEDDWASLATDIIRNATGASLNTKKSLAEIHSGMVSLMSQLSSYSVQFVATINAGSVTKLDVPEALCGAQVSSISGTMPAPVPETIVRDAKYSIKTSVGRGLLNSDTGAVLSTHIHAYAHVDTTVTGIRSTILKTAKDIPVPIVGLRSVAMTQS